ncbi:F-box domain protein [Penicillium brasilianum]|uniref:F-box domain protein n=1 Tax=Penicillium brasilianum TaxID=104259 RepID=A0A1S9RQS6_PENBI|nr:F-box domain protein [Penicillium brasilianum]
MSSLLDRLPNELLDQIISYLDIEPPSYTQLHLEPGSYITISENTPLKHLSQSCSCLATFVRPYLFAHARLVLHYEPSEFCSFVREWDLARYIKSITVLVSDKDLPQRATGHWLNKIFEFIDPLRITILAPPRIIGEALQTPIDEQHGWAFDIDQQIIQLEKKSCGNVDAYRPHPSENLLCTRPWTSLSFNEGSSLKAYNHYEYFSSHVPSVLSQWGHEDPPMHFRAEMEDCFRGIESLSYTAIFPFYNHVENVNIVMRLMPRLRVVTVQLAPDANNHATELEQRGSMDPNDPWMELESAYSILGFNIQTKSSVQEFRSRDFHVEAVRLDLESALREQLPGWTHDNRGKWTRPPSGETS